MHILHVTPYYAPAYAFGGVVRAVQGLAETQVQHGQQVTVLTTNALTLDSTIATQHEVINGVSVHRVANVVYPLRRMNLSTPLQMRQVASTLLDDVDIVHVHEFRTIENLLVMPEAKKRGIPVVLSPHGTLNLSTGRSTIKKLWDRLFSPRLAKSISHIIALAEAEKKDIASLWQQFDSSPQISVIPNGVHLSEFEQLPDASAFRQRYGLGDARIVLFMGRLHERKGVLELLYGFQLANFTDVKLVFAGPDEGMLETLKQVNAPNVIFTGYLDSDERLEALAAADIFALPAVGEGLSMAVLEALAAGVPVLLSHGCNLPEAQTANAGLIVEPQQDNLLVALREMLDNSSLTDMSTNAQKLIRERFTWDVVAQKMQTVYTNILEQSQNS